MNLHTNLLYKITLLSLCQLFSIWAHSEGHQEGATKEDPLKFAKDTGHIKEHLQHQYGFTSDQADRYLQEYDAQTQFFVMHDYDNNTKLDGLELLKSMTHFHDEHEDEHKDEKDKFEENTDTLVEFVDMILKDQDYNRDGYIDYPEYISYYSNYEAERNKEKTTPAAPPVAQN